MINIGDLDSMIEELELNMQKLVKKSENEYDFDKRIKLATQGMIIQSQINLLYQLKGKFGV